MSVNNRHLLQVNNSGKYYVYSVKSKKRILSGTYLDDEFVIFTDEGYYESTSEGSQYVWRYYPGGKNIFTFNQFEDIYKRRDIIDSVLNSDNFSCKKQFITSPPEVELMAKFRNKETGEVEVNVNTNSETPLKKICIYIDGNLFAEKQANGNDSRDTFNIPVNKGVHWITGMAVNSDGYSSLPKAVTINSNKSVSEKSTVFILGIGIDKYPRLQENQQLKYTQSDVKKFLKTCKEMKCQNDYTLHIDTLFGMNTGIDKILKHMEEIYLSAKKEDLVILYFSGHGTMDEDNKLYLLVANSTEDNYKNDALPWQKVKEIAKKSEVKTLALIDACNSGASIISTMYNYGGKDRENNSKRANMTIIASSKGRQKSIESDLYGDGQSAFNYALCQVLDKKRYEYDRNGNGVIEISELYRGLKEIVKKITEDKQTPWMFRDEISGDFSIFY
jgi:hypothetical protein